MDIADLLSAAEHNKASDLHLSPNNPPILRIHGEVRAMQGTRLDAATIHSLLLQIMTDAQRAEYEEELEIDLAISFGENTRFRVNAFNTLNGPGAVLRAIPSRILSLEELDAPPVMKRLATCEKGMILVTGPTGSGKSTTMAAIINHINHHYHKHILTIEDPIEFIHPTRKSLVNQREVGPHTRSFSRALKSALREDPDVILVGELRDLETIQLAMTAAETGHLVMGTLHTSSAPKTVDRIIDVFPAEQQGMVRSMLAGSIEAIITQTLIRKADGTGRVAAHEILIGTPNVRNLIRESKIPQLYSMMQVGSKHGMVTMKDSLYRLYEKGLIHSEDAKLSGEEAANAGSDGSASSNF